MIKAIIFDMDGVLVDSLPLHFEAWKRTLKPYGISYTKKQFDDVNGRSTEDIASIRVGEYGLRGKEPYIVAAKKTHAKDLLQKAELFPGVRRKIAQLSERYPLAVATSANRSDAKVIVRKFSLDKIFKAIIDANDVNKAKPAPEIFLECAKRLRVRPSECLVIEDSVLGIKAAKRAGMICIAITNSFPKRMLAKADAIVESMAQINHRLIDRMSRNQRHAGGK